VLPYAWRAHIFIITKPRKAQTRPIDPQLACRQIAASDGEGHRRITGSDPEQGPSVKLFDGELAPEAPTGADEDDDQAERQVDADDLADAVEAGAGVGPVLNVDGAFECQPWSVE
jgi:hypothetical protein